MAYEQYQMKELGAGLNAFNKPVEYSGIEAWTRLITELLFTIPGTYSTDPDLGIGIQTYRYSFTDDVKPKLKKRCNDQIRKYLPDIPLRSLNFTETIVNGKEILVLSLVFTVKDEDLKTAYVAIDTASKTINYEVSF